MNRFQFTIIILVLITIIFSVLSLGMINKSNEVEFAWFSQVKNQFIPVERNVKGDEWFLGSSNRDIKVGFILSNTILGDKKLQSLLPSLDFYKNVYLMISMENISSKAFRMKVSRIAQVGNKVYVKVSLNSPKVYDGLSNETLREIIMIRKSQLVSKSKLTYIFEDQYGTRLAVLNGN